MISMGTERLLGQRQEFGGILGNAQGIGGDGPYRTAIQTAQAFAEAAQAIQRPRLRGGIEAFVGHQAGCQAHWLLHRIQGVNLVIDHPPDLQTKTIGTQVDGGDGLVNHWLGEND
jgi:hypothetical protein